MTLKRGAPVLFRDEVGSLVRGRIRNTATWKGERRVVITALDTTRSMSQVRKRDDEGRTWCRGWTSKAARALEVAEALGA